jgi:hypothetical protein
MNITNAIMRAINNNTIARFMGGLTEPFELPQHGTIRPNGDFKTEFTIEQLKYHKSWDWLMPVVLECFECYDYGTMVSDDLNFKLNDALLETNIESLYKVVVEFINEYNKYNHE